MKKIFLKLFCTLNIFPNLFFNTAFTNHVSEKVKVSSFNINDYEVNSESATRNYDGQLNKEVSDPSAKLVETNNFVWQFKISIDDYDKKIIQNNLLNSYLEFDFLEQATSCGRKVQIQNHINLDLSDSNNLNDFECDYYVIYFCGPDGSKQDAPMNSILHFSFDSNGDLLITTLRRDIPLVAEKYEKIDWRKIVISNISLTFNKPEEFKNASNYEISSTYIVNDINKQDLQENINNAFETNPLSKYLYLGDLTDDDITSLQQITNDLQTNIDLKLYLKSKYNQPLIEEMLLQKTITINLNQIVNLDKLNIEKSIEIEQGQDPVKLILEQNSLYKSFLLNKCSMTYNNDDGYVYIESDSTSITGELKILVSIKKPKIIKKDLSELNLENDLGDIYTETDNWFFDDSYYFELWKSKNQDLLFEQELKDYEFGILQGNEIKVTATNENEKYSGSVMLTMNIITPSDLKKDISKLNLQTDLGEISISENDDLANEILIKFIEINPEVNDIDSENCEITIENNIALLKMKETNLNYKGEIRLYFELIKKKIDLSNLNLQTNIGKIDYCINDDINLLIFQKLLDCNDVIKNKINLDDVNIVLNDGVVIITIINDNSDYKGSITIEYTKNIEPININDLNLNNTISKNEIEQNSLTKPEEYLIFWFNNNREKNIPSLECFECKIDNDTLLISVNDKTEFYDGCIKITLPNQDDVKNSTNNKNGDKNLFLIIGTVGGFIFSSIAVFIGIFLKRKRKLNKK